MIDIAYNSRLGVDYKLLHNSKYGIERFWKMINQIYLNIDFSNNQTKPVYTIKVTIENFPTDIFGAFHGFVQDELKRCDLEYLWKGLVFNIDYHSKSLIIYEHE